MANNYLQYSTQYDFPRNVTEEENKKICNLICKVGSKAYADSMGSKYEDEFDDGEPLEDQYIGTDFEIGKDGIWFYADEGGDPDIVISIVQALQDYFEDDEKFIFSWAYTCSKPRLDEFGGGAAGIRRGEDPYFVDALTYVTNFMNR